MGDSPERDTPPAEGAQPTMKELLILEFVILGVIETTKGIVGLVH